MLAFDGAIRLGYRYVETDVHATRDGVAVTFHDDTLDRLAGRSERIGELSYAALRQVRVGDQPIPRLEDVLGTWPEVRVEVDVKHDAAVPALLLALDRTRAHDRVCAGSFSDRRVKRIRRETGGRLCTWMGSRGIACLRLASLGLPMPDLTAGCTQVPVRYGPLRLVDRRFIETAHRRGVAVHVLTINDRTEMERFLDAGVDGVLSDTPSLLKAVFVARGLWVS
jgi:glycerophosphoryl diester phosphodiesterase